MKNKKVLVGLLSASGMAMMLPAITSCGCSPKYNAPEVSASTPKVREVGAKATRTYFMITQSNIKNPEETKVKMVNLKVSGADAKPVAGLIKYRADSAGNILVTFNMALALTQYQTDKLEFSLKLTNKTADTEYTIDGFVVTLSDQSSAVTYNTEQAVGITFVKNPETVGEGEDLDIQFYLENGCEWKDCDITVDGQSVKEKLEKLEADRDPDDIHYWYFVKGGKTKDKSYIYLPAELINSNSDIQVVLKSQGSYFDVIRDFDHFSSTDLPAQIQHGQGWQTYNFARDAYHSVDIWDVCGTELSLKESGDATFDEKNKQLKINTDAVVENITVRGHASAAKFTVSMAETDHLDASSVDVTYGTSSNTITIKAKSDYQKKYKPKQTLTCVCTDYESGQPGDPFTITSVNDNGVYAIPDEKILGNITISTDDVEEGCKYEIDTSGVTKNATWTAITAGKPQYGTDYKGTLKPENAYYELNSDWDVKRYNDETKEYDSIKTEVSLSGETLTIPGTSITDNLQVSATAKGKSWEVTTNLGDLERYETKSIGKVTYGLDKDYTADIIVDDEYFDYSLDTTTMKCFTYDVVNKTNVDIASSVTLATTATAKKLLLTIKKEAILGPVTLAFKQDAKTFAVDASGVGANLSFVGSTGEKAAARRSNYEATITPDTYYEIDTLTIVSGTKTLEKDTDYTYSNNELKIYGTSIVGNITISATAKKIEYDVDVTGTTGGLTFTAPSQKPTHGDAYAITYSLTAGTKLDVSSVKCVIGTKTLTIGNGLTLTATATEQKIAITNPDDIVGKLTFTGSASPIAVASTATGIASVTPAATPEYLKSLTLNFTMTDGYAFHADDFKNKKVKIYNGASTSEDNLIDPGNFTYGTSSVTIAAGVITNDINITGTVLHYTASAAIGTGMASVITGLTFDTVATDKTEYKVTFATASGYLTPTATVKVGGTELETSKYTISTTGIIIPSEEVTGKIEITNITALKELEWENADDTVKINSTTSAYSAKAAAGGTPTVSVSGDLPTGVTWNDTNKTLTADSTATVGAEITIQATLTGAQTITKTVTVAEEAKELAVSGDHNLDVDTGSTWQLSATYGGESVAATDCTWAVSEGSSVTVGTNTGTVSINSAWNKTTTSGYAKISCTYKSVTSYHEVDVGSYSKVDLVDGKWESAEDTSGVIVIPSRKWVGTSSTPTIPTEIPEMGFQNQPSRLHTGVVIPETVTTIGKASFGSSSYQYIQSIWFSGTPTLTDIPESTFQYQPLTSITIPASVKSIDYHAFAYCDSLTSVTFKNQSNWVTWYASGDIPAGTTATVTNAGNNATYLRNVTAGSTNSWGYSGIKRNS